MGGCPRENNRLVPSVGSRFFTLGLVLCFLKGGCCSLALGFIRVCRFLSVGICFFCGF